jgi:phage/plasmid-like protein (TIGR03299 family)
MAHEVETMAYAGETPWHGLGKKVSNKLSPDEMLKAAGLDWSVDLKPCFTNIGTDKKPKIIDVGRNALVRSTDNKVLTVTGKDWKPLQNRDALGFFKDYVKEGGATLETAGSLRGGKIVWALANLNDSFTLSGSDKVLAYLLLISPHEVGQSIRGFLTPVRVVCKNTMRMAEIGGKQGLFRQNHLGVFDATAAKRQIGLLHKQFDAFKEDAQTLEGLKVSERETLRIFAKFFQPLPKEHELAISNPKSTKVTKKDIMDANNWIDKILAEPKRQSVAFDGVMESLTKAPGAQPGTGWGVLNAVTHFCDHVAGREQDARMFNAWLGEKSRRKLEVKAELLSLV